MTCIAWDGQTLAADRQATLDGICRTVCKILNIADATPTQDGLFPGGSAFITGTGDFESFAALVEWVRDGERQDKWPNFQKHDGFYTLVVVRLNLKFQPTLYMYEALPIRQMLDPTKPFAWGCDGRLALAAMAAGASAEQAVEIASSLSIYSGLGVDKLAVSAL